MKTIPFRLQQLLGIFPVSYFEEKITSKPGYWGERILSQLVYAYEISKVKAFKHDETIMEALTYLEERITDEGVITKETSGAYPGSCSTQSGICLSFSSSTPMS